MTWAYYNDCSQRSVKEFFEVFNKPERQPLDSDATRLNIKLIEEECKELIDEVWQCIQEGKIRPNLLKEIADLRYVISNLTVNLGIDEEVCVELVHQSNLTKLGLDGEPHYREDGKILKGPNYKEPNFDDLVKELNGDLY